MLTRPMHMDAILVDRELLKFLLDTVVLFQVTVPLRPRHDLLTIDSQTPIHLILLLYLLSHKVWNKCVFGRDTTSNLLLPTSLRVRRTHRNRRQSRQHIELLLAVAHATAQCSLRHQIYCLELLVWVFGD